MASERGQAAKFESDGDNFVGVLIEDDVYPSNTSEVTIEALFKVDFIKNHGEENQEGLIEIHTKNTEFWELRVTKWDTLPSFVYNNDTVITTTSDFEPHWQ